jgi:hypothetical protein
MTAMESAKEMTQRAIEEGMKTEPSYAQLFCVRCSERLNPFAAPFTVKLPTTKARRIWFCSEDCREAWKAEPEPDATGGQTSLFGPLPPG